MKADDKRNISPACPICGAPTAAAYRPFCSRRCADVDLGRWLTGAYAAPAEDHDDLAGAASLTADEER